LEPLVAGLRTTSRHCIWIVTMVSLLQYSLTEQLRTAISQSSGSLTHGMKLAVLFPKSALAYWPLVHGEHKEFFPKQQKMYDITKTT
jgi:hypothetical protein